MVNTTSHITDRIWTLLEEVNDPEVPVLSIVDLGVVRDIKEVRKAGGVPEAGEETPADETAIEVIITPTYSGCPAMDAIRMNIRMVLLQNGYKNATITTILSPAWTTDWMSEKGKNKLKAYGIAPPLPSQQVCHPALFQQEEAIPCPRCNSYHTQLISQFGSTACKALYRCKDCKEPFDYFKCH